MYRTVRLALSVLDPDGHWCQELKELWPEDIRGPRKEADESNRRFVMSWIWMTQTSDNSSVGTEAEFNESMHVEWMKAQARGVDESPGTYDEMAGGIFDTSGRNAASHHMV